MPLLRTFLIIGMVLFAVLLLVRQLTTYSISTNRAEPFIIHLTDQLSVSSDGPVFSALFRGDFLPASVRIHHQQQIYYIDPFLIGRPKPADVILVTHDHPDHFSPADIQKIYQPDKTRIIAPPAVAKRLSKLPVTVLQPGESLQLEQCTITGIPAASIKIPTHPRQAGYLGYLLHCDSQRIYHAGDTHLLPEMDDLTDLSLAILPIRGGLFTMSTAEAAKIVCRIKPRLVFPLHYPLHKGEADHFAQLVCGATTVVAYPEKTQPS